MAIKKEIKPQLKNTFHTMEMLRAEYELEMHKFENEKLKGFKEYYYNMNSFERDIFVLYCEYGSYRMVAQETYCSHQMVSLIMNVIRNEIKALQIESFTKNTIFISLVEPEIYPIKNDSNN